MKLFLPSISVCALLLSNIVFTSHSIANTFNSNDLTSTQDLVKAGDKYVTLLGNQVDVGEKAPEFKVVDKFCTYFIKRLCRANYIDIRCS